MSELTQAQHFVRDVLGARLSPGKDCVGTGDQTKPSCGSRPPCLVLGPVTSDVLDRDLGPSGAALLRRFRNVHARGLLAP